MIQVQIASQVTAGGVGGIRWVLVDADDDAAAAPTAPGALPAASTGAAVGTAATAPQHVPTRPAVPLALLKLAVLGLSAGLAMWFAQASFGPMTAPAWSATERAQPILRITPPPPPAATQPVPAEPSSPASAAASLLTAELR